MHRPPLVLCLSCLFVVVLAAAGRAAAPPPAHATPAGIQGAGASGLYVANLDPAQAAVIVADFYSQAGGAPTSSVRAGVAAGRQAAYYLPDEIGLRRGAYAATVSADRPIAALARIDWPSSGGAVAHPAAAPDTDVLVPLVAKQWQGQSSLLTIQNTDTSAQTTVSLALHADGAIEPTKTVDLAIGPGTSITIDLDRDPQFLDLPPDFVGWARVTAPTPVAVHALVDVATSQKGVYDVATWPAESASDALYVPLAAAEDQRGLTSELFVLNPGAAPVDVVVVYTGLAGPCAGQEITRAPTSIGPGGVERIAQSPGDGPEDLPAGCVAAARVASTGGPIVATVRIVGGDAGSIDRAAGYAPLALDGTAERVHVPLWQKDYLGATSVIGAMNVDAGPAILDVEPFDVAGRPIAGCASCAAIVPAGGAWLWSPADEPALDDGTLGSLVIASSRPIAVAVLDGPASAAGGRVDLTAARGLHAAASSSIGPRTARAHVPILVNESGAPGPFRTPEPTAPPTETPVPTPTVPATATPDATATPVASPTPPRKPAYLPMLVNHT